MGYLSKYLSGSHIDAIYTFRKGRLDIHFSKEEQAYRLSWEKQGNEALLTFTSKFTLPKKRVDLFRNMPAVKLEGIRLNKKDRALKLSFSEDIYLLFGFFPSALNIYLFQKDQVLSSFFKLADLPVLSDQWLAPGDSLPEEIPGPHLTKQDIQNAEKGLDLDAADNTIIFGSYSKTATTDFSEFVINVLRSGKKPKASPAVSIRKTGQTVLKRWKSKLSKISDELSEAHSWPVLETRLHVLQTGLSMGKPVEAGELSLRAEISPTGESISIKVDQDSTLLQAIESTAKKIRKFKGKEDLLQPVVSDVKQDIERLIQLLANEDDAELLPFLQKKGEALNQSGTRQTERKAYKLYHSPNGFDILVGRGSRDNDILTFKIANKNDWWFHARQVSGSHVILRTGNRIPEQLDIQKAAEHAALNSKARHSGIAVVQYCQRKHLSKPKGSSPGIVLVHEEHTITIDIDSVR